MGYFPDLRAWAKQAFSEPKTETITVPISDFANAGTITDCASYDLPLTAFKMGDAVRWEDGRVIIEKEKIDLDDLKASIRAEGRADD